MMNCSQIDTFLSVVKKGSISKAAKELHLTQPAISAQIAALENMLGVKLFYRSRKGTFLTKEGEILLYYAKRINNLHNNLQRQINKTTAS